MASGAIIRRFKARRARPFSEGDLEAKLREEEQEEGQLVHKLFDKWLIVSSIVLKICIHINIYQSQDLELGQPLCS